MSSYINLVNRLLPFATPGTPLAQDLVHLLVLCSLLYFAPQLQEWIQSRTATEAHADDAPVTDNVIEEPAEEEIQQVGHEQPAAHLPDNHEHDAANEQPPDFRDDAGPALAGPATEPRDQRQVGAKKAKSLARRDQRRAYHEFQRSQGEAQRAQEAEGAAEREAVLAAERERRRVAESALEAKKAKEREHRRDLERREREEEIRRRELTVSLVRGELKEKRTCDLFKVARQVGDDVDEEWVEKILNACGIIGRKGDTMTMITGMGWVVQVRKEDMTQLYNVALEQGQEGKERFEYGELGLMLEAIL